MTCPICNQKIDPSDHSEKWGPEFAHSRCVIAFTAGSAIQNAKLQDRIKRLEEESESRWMLAQSATGSCAEMSSRIKRLEEAGDELASWSPSITHASKWRKAKEAKP